MAEEKLNHLPVRGRGRQHTERPVRDGGGETESPASGGEEGDRGRLFSLMCFQVSETQVCNFFLSPV